MFFILITFSLKLPHDGQMSELAVKYFSIQSNKVGINKSIIITKQQFLNLQSDKSNIWEATICNAAIIIRASIKIKQLSSLSIGDLYEPN